MPEKEGMETILELKKIDPSVKIIVVSGGGRSVPEDYLSIAEYFGAIKSFRKPSINPPQQPTFLHSYSSAYHVQPELQVA